VIRAQRKQNKRKKAKRNPNTMRLGHNKTKIKERRPKETQI
jgi:hypothetical protein